jgi:hypothetical protein
LRKNTTRLPEQANMMVYYINNEVKTYQMPQSWEIGMAADE